MSDTHGVVGVTAQPNVGLPTGQIPKPIRHQTPSGRRMGLKRASPDFRDRRYHATTALGLLGGSVPEKFIPEGLLAPAYDQGNLGSCTGHGGAGLMQVLSKGLMTSRLGLYYETRLWEGDVPDDSGCEVRDILKVLMRYGAIKEDEWPYEVSKFADKPLPWRIVNEALAHRIAGYSRIVTEAEATSCICAGGAIIFGVQLYESFDGEEMARTGIMTWPNSRELIIGGHCMLWYGYDLRFKESDWFKKSGIDPRLVADEMALVRNSWGPEWGIGGDAWMPISYILNPSCGGDSWTAHL